LFIGAGSPWVLIQPKPNVYIFGICGGAYYHEGHISLIQWMRARGCPWNEQCTAHAAHGGHLRLLEYLRENGCPWEEHTW